MNPNIQSALQALEEANYVGYFAEMDKVSIPAHLRNTYATHKGVFAYGQTPFDFHQKLEVFAREVDKQLNTPATPVQTPRNYNLPNIRKILMEGLNDTDLSTLCQDYFPEVHNAFGDTQNKAQKVNALLDYCKRRLKMDFLLDQLQDQYPEQYGLHGPYF